MFTFELVVYAVKMFDDFIIEHFSLFLMDVLVIILNCFKRLLDNEYDIDEDVEKVRDLMELFDDNDHLTLLKSKFDVFMKSIQVSY